MTKPNDRIIALLYKPLTGELLTPGEERELEEWMTRSGHNHELYEELNHPEKLRRELRQLMDMEWHAVWKRITVKITDTE